MTSILKKILVTISLYIGYSNFSSYAQSISCQELYEIVSQNYDYRDVVNPLMSTMLAKVTYYTIEGRGFVVANLKRNDFDYQGIPYIFCGISGQRWAKFKSEGILGSWGQSFHSYIREFTCNCN